MATRLNYALPIARQLLLGASRRLRPGGRAARLPRSGEGRPFIIVTGAGRSGTSAVSRVLHESGIRMGSEFGPPADFNPHGFYQETGLHLTNEQILAELGMVDRWRRWPWRSTVLAVAERYQEQIEALSANATEGWKDPIFSLTLEAWLPFLPSSPKLVVCLRSPQAYAQSVTSIFGLVDPHAAERQWASHYRRLLDIIRDYDLEATCVEYNVLVERPQETVAALAEFVGHPLKPEYVDPPLRQFTRPVPKKYARLYQEVQALGGSNSPAPSPGAGNRGGAPVAITTGAARESESLGEEAGQTIDAYIQQVDEIDIQAQTSKAAWTVAIGLPRPKLSQFERLGLTLSETMRQTRAASASHASVLNDAQQQLVALDPPPGFERYHEMAQREVNLERMVVELLLAAVQGEAADPRTLKAAMRAWRRFGRGAAMEKAREGRQREYERALEASGYLAARAKASDSS